MVHTFRKQGLTQLNALKHQASVRTAKAKIIFDSHVNLHVPCSIGAIVQIAFGVLIEDVDRRRTLLVVQCQYGKYRLNAARATQKVARHGLR